MKNARKKDKRNLESIARLIKKDILTISYRANVGHVGCAFSIADITTVLYQTILRINPDKPHDPERDRFILSKGHAATALYANLYRRGFISRKDLLSFCSEGGALGVHPVYDLKKGIELSTGSLGHGLPVAAGMALGLKKPRIFVLISDAELNEGSTWEGIMFAAHHKLDNLVVILDDNNFQAFGRASDVMDLQPVEEKWRAFGWGVRTVDGHDVEELENVFRQLPFEKNRPSVVVAKTTTGKGLSHIEDTQEAHYLPLTKKQYEHALKYL